MKLNKVVVNPEQELTQQVVKVNRVSKTTKGGRTFTFSALVVVGNQQGIVGCGLGKANEVTPAIQKAVQEAKKNLVEFPIRGQRTLYHAVTGKFKSTSVIIGPAAPGTGNIAGGALRIILEKLGVKDVLTKIHGSTNPHNVVKATFRALAELRDPYTIAKQRNITLTKLFNG